MASIVEWQSLKMQEYRYSILVGISKFFELFGVRRPVRYEKPVMAGDYDEAIHADSPDTFMDRYMNVPLGEHVGRQANVTAETVPDGTKPVEPNL
jgi:hypothetical protein